MSCSDVDTCLGSLGALTAFPTIIPGDCELWPPALDVYRPGWPRCGFANTLQTWSMGIGGEKVFRQLFGSSGFVESRNPIIIRSKLKVSHRNLGVGFWFLIRIYSNFGQVPHQNNSNFGKMILTFHRNHGSDSSNQNPSEVYPKPKTITGLYDSCCDVAGLSFAMWLVVRKDQQTGEPDQNRIQV